MIVLCTVLCLCYTAVHGQFPIVCTTNEALQKKECCPKGADGTSCGSGSGRGRCVDIVASGNPTAQAEDDRMDWPTHYYNRTCQCNGNYGRFDCGGCKAGYSGDNCERNKTCVRKEVLQLTEPELQNYLGAMRLAKTTTSKLYAILTCGNRRNPNAYQFVNTSVYDLCAWMHNYANAPQLIKGNFDYSRNFAHGGSVFCPWHRSLLNFFEQQIQELTGDENFCLPYLDWGGASGCSVCNNKYLCANDIHGNLDKSCNFSSWKCICSGNEYSDIYCYTAIDECQREVLHRKPGFDPRISKPSSVTDVINALKWSTYDAPPFDNTARKCFRIILEGSVSPSDGQSPYLCLHNLFHSFIGGTMGRVAISACDPLFYLHHCFIDKIYNVWLMRYNISPKDYPNSTMPGHGPNDYMVPFIPCTKPKDYMTPGYNHGISYSENRGM